MPTPTLRGLNNTTDSDTLYAINDVGMPIVASIGAGVLTTTVQGSKVLPFNYKIRKVSVFLTAIDSTAGADAFNLVVGGIPGTTGAYSQNNAAPNDNSQSGPGTASAPAGLGYPTNIAVAGQTVFANDVPFNIANAYGSGTGGSPGFGGLTGYGFQFTGWQQLTTTGGVGIFVPTNYDAVYPCNLPLSVRVSTVASTGSISNLAITLGLVFMPLRKGPTPGQNAYGIPGLDF